MSKGSESTLDKIESKSIPRVSKQWVLVLWNNDVTSFEVVLDVLINGLGISPATSYSLMMNAHNQQYSIVLQAAKSVCEVKLQIAQEYCKELHNINPTYKYDQLKFSIEKT